MNIPSTPHSPNLTSTRGAATPSAWPSTSSIVIGLEESTGSSVSGSASEEDMSMMSSPAVVSFSDCAAEVAEVVFLNEVRTPKASRREV